MNIYLKNHLLLIATIFFILFDSCTFKKKISNNAATTYHKFHPGNIWYDTDSLHINAHGGGILFHQGTYYWFGEHKTAGSKGNTSLVGVRSYSSKDLYNWKNEGVALSSENDPNSEITIGCVMERPKVIYNKKTQKFVMWFHLELKDQGYAAARTAVATSDHISGPYTYLKSFRVNPKIWPIGFTPSMMYADTTEDEWWTPEWRKEVENGLFVRRDFENGQMSRDMTLFVDADGKAYHIHSSEENLTIHISELTSDYLNFTGKWIRLFPGGHNEAPALFKYNGKYYMITSGCTGWDPNEARLSTANSIWGPWEMIGNPCVGKNAELTFSSQSTFVLPVEGTKEAFMFMADRWNPKNPIDGRYVWLPISFDENIPTIKWYDEWDLSIFNH